jgi:hypothetical protein
MMLTTYQTTRSHNLEKHNWRLWAHWQLSCATVYWYQYSTLLCWWFDSSGTAVRSVNSSGGFNRIAVTSSLTLLKRWNPLSSDTAQHPECAALRTSNLAILHINLQRRDIMAPQLTYLTNTNLFLKTISTNHQQHLTKHVITLKVKKCLTSVWNNAGIKCHLQYPWHCSSHQIKNEMGEAGSKSG